MHSYNATPPPSRLVRLTSPSLNYVIGIGIILFNIGAMMFIQPQVPLVVQEIFCPVSQHTISCRHKCLT